MPGFVIATEKLESASDLQLLHGQPAAAGKLAEKRAVSVLLFTAERGPTGAD